MRPTLLSCAFAAFALLNVLSCRPAVDAEGEADLIRQAEQRRVRALVDADMEAARALHADDFELITPAGTVLTRDEYLQSVATGESDYRLWEPEAIEVRVYGDAAVIRYRSQLQIVLGGQDLGVVPHWHTDLYEKRGGQWQVVWSQATN